MRLTVSLILTFLCFSIIDLFAISTTNNFDKDYLPKYERAKDSLRFENLPLQEYKIDLGLKPPTAPKTAGGAFFKPVALGFLIGAGAGALFGLATGPTGDLSRSDTALVWAAALGGPGLGFGIVMGFDRLWDFNKAKKEKEKINNLNN